MRGAVEYSQTRVPMLPLCKCLTSCCRTCPADRLAPSTMALLTLKCRVAQLDSSLVQEPGHRCSALTMIAGLPGNKVTERVYPVQP